MNEVPRRSSEKRRASTWQVAKAVFWSFLGIRKQKDYDEDSVTITPLQVVIAGIIGGILFVLVLLTVVRIVISNASGG